MSNSIQHKRSDLPGAIPVAADLRVGELAINLADRLMYTKDSTDAIIPLVTQGVDGLSVLSGLGAPVGGIGVDGEFYIDVTPYNIYGPKAAGIWGAPTSLIGPEGPAGLDGEDGTSVTIKGSAPWATISAIVGPTINDMWILTEATGAPARPDATPAQVGDGVSWNGSAWLNLGPIRGPVGPAGATGATGAPGTPGAPGADGSDGVDGTNGAMWYSGGVAPLSSLGADGDMFLLLTNGDLYQKAAGEWELIDNIMGPQGPAGTNGTNGAAGAAGSVWYTAAGAPGAGTGINGDYYLNTSNGDYYQKVSGTWTLRGNLTGPTGQGVIPGGAVGQVLTKASTTDYATQWSTPVVAPTDHGLLTGLADDDHTQYLTQARGDARYYTESEVDIKIAAVPVIPAGGTTGQVLAKINSTNYNTQWTTPAAAAANYWTLTGSDITNNNAGNVGIGGAPGVFKLGVTGAANITESLTVGLPVDFWAGTPNGFFNLVGRPGALLGWIGSAGSNRVVVGSNAYRNNASGTSYLGAGGVTDNGSQIELAPTGEIYFKNGPAAGINLTQRMVIDAAGDVGIGSNPPVGKLGVEGAIGGTSTLTLYAATTGSSIITLGEGRTGNGNSYIDLVGDATHTDYGLRLIRAASGANTNSQLIHRGTGELSLRCTDAGTLGLYTTNAQRFSIAAGGAVTINNLAGTGDRLVTASATGVLTASAAAGPTAGTFATPTWYNGLGVSYHASRYVRWARLGDVVFVNGRLQWTALTGQAGVPATISCGTMPVPIADQTMAWGETSGIDFNSGVHHHMLAINNSGTTVRIVLNGVQDADVAIAYSYNSVGNSGFINFNGFYFTNDP